MHAAVAAPESLPLPRPRQTLGSPSRRGLRSGHRRAVRHANIKASPCIHAPARRWPVHARLVTHALPGASCPSLRWPRHSHSVCSPVTLVRGASAGWASPRLAERRSQPILPVFATPGLRSRRFARSCRVGITLTFRAAQAPGVSAQQRRPHGNANRAGKSTKTPTPPSGYTLPPTNGTRGAPPGFPPPRLACGQGGSRHRQCSAVGLWGCVPPPSARLHPCGACRRWRSPPRGRLLATPPQPHGLRVADAPFSPLPTGQSSAGVENPAPVGNVEIEHPKLRGPTSAAGSIPTFPTQRRRRGK
jgi:hypothetical protein